MKFLHLADLHLGKVIHGVSLLDSGDQAVWVDRFLTMAQELRPDAVVIAGDVYDRSSPSGEAVALLSRLVTELSRQGAAVLIAAGNHDSGQRLSFAGELLAKERVHIAGTPGRTLQHVALQDEYGEVTFWLMPYVFPALVNHVLETDDVRDYDTAVRRLLAAQSVDFSRRNVIVAHQNVTVGGDEAPRGGSESMVGGVGQVEHTAFDGFDYAALGHIHAAYAVGRPAVRYAGSPLCYHFNETRQGVKGPVLVELGAKGTPPLIRTLTIPPLHPMRELRGAYEAIRAQELSGERRGEYLRLVLTDRPMAPEISDFFRSLAAKRGSVLMECVSEFRRGDQRLEVPEARALRERSLEELFADFFTDRSGGQSPSDKDLALLRRAGELIRSSDGDSCRRTAESPQAESLLRLLLEQEGDPL